MELKLTKNPLKIELNLSQFRAKTEVECVELYSDSVGNQWGILFELVWNWLANPMFSFWIVWGMHRGCWGRSGEFIRGFYELFRKQLIFVGPAGECIGNSSGILTNYLGNRWYSSGPLENLWGLLVKNSFVGRGPNTNRAHPHACDIPYKTALPVPCTHRFVPRPVLLGRRGTFEGSAQN